MSSETCPKCAQPRFPNSLDCPYCGIVYDRYRGDPEGGERGAGAGHGGDPAVEAAASPGGTPPGHGDGRDDGGVPPMGEPPAPAPGSTAEHPATATAAAPAAHGLPDVYDGADADGLYTPPADDGKAGGGRRRPPAIGDGPVQIQPTLLNENLGISLIVVLMVAVALYGFWHREMLGVRDTMEAARQDFTRLTGFSPPDRSRVAEGSSWFLAGYKVVLMEKEGASADDFGLIVLVVHPGKFGGDPGQVELLDAVEERLSLLKLPFKRTSDRNRQIHGSEARSRSWSLEDDEWTYGSASALAFQAPDGKAALLVAAGAPGRVARIMREVTL